MHEGNRTEISTLGEFGLIKHLTEDIKLQNEESKYGVGDDAAVLDFAGKQVLVTTDLLMEGVHFDLVYTPLKHLGYKSAMVNFSDIYAMNGTPKQITVSLAVSKRFCIEDLEDFYDGVKLACQLHHVDIVGGDTTSSVTGLAISITCIGEADKDKVVYRNGAKDTDLICVSGDLGAAYMGLQLMEREKAVFQGEKDVQPDFAGKEYLLERQLKPEARKDIIERLREAGVQHTAWHPPYSHDGYFRRPFFGTDAYLFTEQDRLPSIRRPYSYRLPDSCHGRRVQHEPDNLRAEWW